MCEAVEEVWEERYSLTEGHTIPIRNIEPEGREISSGTYGVVIATKEGAVKISNWESASISWEVTSHEMYIMRSLAPPFNRETNHLLQPLAFSLDQGLILTELGDSDLSNYMFQMWTIDEARELMWQIALGVKAMHDNNVAHLDLKPQNIIMFGNTPKIGDFGLSQTMMCNRGPVNKKLVSIYWRPPEIFLGLPFDTKVDIWSLGVIFYQMQNRKHDPLFPFTPDPYPQSGLSQHEQYLLLIHSIVGSINITSWPELEREMRKGFISLELQKFLRKNRGGSLKINNPLLLDLLKRMLVPNPSKRADIEEVLQHPFFAPVRPEGMVIMPYSCVQTMGENAYYPPPSSSLNPVRRANIIKFLFNITKGYPIDIRLTTCYIIDSFYWLVDREGIDISHIPEKHIVRMSLYISISTVTGKISDTEISLDELKIARMICHVMDFRLRPTLPQDFFKMDDIVAENLQRIIEICFLSGLIFDFSIPYIAAASTWLASALNDITTSCGPYPEFAKVIIELADSLKADHEELYRMIERFNSKGEVTDGGVENEG